MKEILYILLDNYAEHEIGFMPGAVSTDTTGFRKEPKYINKMVAPTMEPVKTFGFSTDWDGIQPNVEMMLDDVRIILYPRSDFEQMVSYKFQYPMGLNGTVELAFDVPSYADVDKEYQHALYHGAIPVLPPTTEPWGQRTCYVADPDGNLIEIGAFSK